MVPPPARRPSLVGRPLVLPQPSHLGLTACRRPRSDRSHGLTANNVHDCSAQQPLEQTTRRNKVRTNQDMIKNARNPIAKNQRFSLADERRTWDEQRNKDESISERGPKRTRLRNDQRFQDDILSSVTGGQPRTWPRNEQIFQDDVCWKNASQLSKVFSTRQ